MGGCGFQLSAFRYARRLSVCPVPNDCEQSYHMFYMLMPSLNDREGLIRHLKTHGIQSVFHYLPLHLSEKGQLLGGRVGDCRISADISDRLVRLPFYNSLEQAEQ